MGAGWVVVDGTGVIGPQTKEQWRLWAHAGENGNPEVSEEEAWVVLRKAAGKSLLSISKTIPR
ncbi:hypothetical protein WAI453_004577 [Rhynchosporium graminicola]